MKRSKEVEETRRERDEAVRPLVASGEELVRRLAHLKEDDRTTIVALLMVTEALGSYSWSVGHSNRRILDPFLQKLTDLSPKLVRQVNFRDMLLGCRDEMIAYASCMARCEDDGVSESECERRCWPELAAEVTCMMGQIDDLRIKIPGIIRDPFPPPPPPID